MWSTGRNCPKLEAATPIFSLLVLKIQFVIQCYTYIQFVGSFSNDDNMSGAGQRSLLTVYLKTKIKLKINKNNNSKSIFYCII